MGGRRGQRKAVTGPGCFFQIRRHATSSADPESEATTPTTPTAITGNDGAGPPDPEHQPQSPSEELAAFFGGLGVKPRTLARKAAREAFDGQTDVERIRRSATALVNAGVTDINRIIQARQC